MNESNQHIHDDVQQTDCISLNQGLIGQNLVPHEVEYLPHQVDCRWFELFQLFVLLILSMVHYIEYNVGPFRTTAESTTIDAGDFQGRHSNKEEQGRESPGSDRSNRSQHCIEKKGGGGHYRNLMCHHNFWYGHWGRNRA
jgi:hypothetical protein